jgi:hypothetical protein
VKANSFAGGGPAATHFLCFAKESKQRKVNPISLGKEAPQKSGAVPTFSEYCRGLRNSRREYVGIFDLASSAPLRQCSPKSPDNLQKKWRLNTGVGALKHSGQHENFVGWAGLICPRG